MPSEIDVSKWMVNTVPTKAIYDEMVTQGLVNSNELYLVGGKTENPLSGKKLSILGDSISSYSGYIPSGYDTYYPTGTVSSVNDMWWKKLIDATEMVLCVNNSYSGTRVAITSWLGDYAGCLPERCMELGDGDNIPDIIIVAMGCNDYNNEINIGGYTPNDGLNFDTTKFSDAYAKMLYLISHKYPASEIYCCTCLASERNTPDDGIDVNGSGVSLWEWNEKIRDIAKMYNCKIIDMESCGITHENLSYYTVDGVQHPNTYGHNLMANAAIKTIAPYNTCRYDNIEPIAGKRVTGITLNKQTLSIEQGRNETLVATISPNDAIMQDVIWESSDNTKAVVSATGTVTAQHTGTCTITVTTADGGYTAQCAVTVTAAEIIDQQVTAITNAAGQYIDTGYVPTNDTKIELDWKRETFVAQMKVVGAWGLAISFGNANGVLVPHRHSNQQSLTYSYDSSERSVLGLDGTTLYRNGAVIDTKATTAVTMTKSLLLFGANDFTTGDGIIACTGTYALYGFKIYEGTSLVKNYVPWVDANGKACLKEIIGGTYLYEANGGNFDYIV